VTRIADDLNVCVRGNYAYTGFGAIAPGRAGSGTGGQLAQAAVGTNVYISGNYTYSGCEYVAAPTTRIAIDPNVRVRGNGTYAGFEDVSGPLTAGAKVEVYEPESGLVGNGQVTEIDAAKELVYLSVDWSSLTDQTEPSGQCGEAVLPLVFVPAGSSWNDDSWVTLATTPCLAYVSFTESAMSVMAPAAFRGALPFAVPDLQARQLCPGNWTKWMVAA